MIKAIKSLAVAIQVAGRLLLIIIHSTAVQTL